MCDVLPRFCRTRTTRDVRAHPADVNAEPKSERAARLSPTVRSTIPMIDGAYGVHASAVAGCGQGPASYRSPPFPSGPTSPSAPCGTPLVAENASEDDSLCLVSNDSRHGDAVTPAMARRNDAVRDVAIAPYAQARERKGWPVGVAAEALASEHARASHGSSRRPVGDARRARGGAVPRMSRRASSRQPGQSIRPAAH